MSDLKNWTPRPFPDRKVLQGRYCRLEPLNVAKHGGDIWAAFAGADSVWAYLPVAQPKTRAEYDALLASMMQNKDICPFTVIVDGKAKGHMWMMEIRPAHGVFEVGWITYSPPLQRTRAATEAVYLIGDAARAEGLVLGIDWSTSGRVVRTGEAVMTADLRTEADASPITKTLTEGVRA